MLCSGKKKECEQCTRLSFYEDEKNVNNPLYCVCMKRCNTRNEKNAVAENKWRGNEMK